MSRRQEHNMWSEESRGQLRGAREQQLGPEWTVTQPGREGEERMMSRAAPQRWVGRSGGFRSETPGNETARSPAPVWSCETRWTEAAMRELDACVRGNASMSRDEARPLRQTPLRRAPPPPGPPPSDRPKFRVFFHSSATIFILSSLSWGVFFFLTTRRYSQVPVKKHPHFQTTYLASVNTLCADGT